MTQKEITVFFQMPAESPQELMLVLPFEIDDYIAAKDYIQVPGHHEVVVHEV
jgi:hypothetical protein